MEVMVFSGLIAVVYIYLLVNNGCGLVKSITGLDMMVSYIYIYIYYICWVVTYRCVDRLIWFGLIVCVS